MTDTVTPTQADRDATESILGEMAMGNEKRAQLVAARHRLDAIATQAAEIARLREALAVIAERPGEGVEYFPGHGDEVCSEARNMELIARAALSAQPDDQGVGK